MRKATGYVSFLKGNHTHFHTEFSQAISNRPILLRNTIILKNLYLVAVLSNHGILRLFCMKTGSYQGKVYSAIIEKLKRQADEGKLAVENMERFGYTLLQKPLEALNMTYPIDAETLDDVSAPSLVGIEGLRRFEFQR